MGTYLKESFKMARGMVKVRKSDFLKDILTQMESWLKKENLHKDFLLQTSE